MQFTSNTREDVDALYVKIINTVDPSDAHKILEEVALVLSRILRHIDDLQGEVNRLSKRQG